MSKFQYYSTREMVQYFLAQGKEGECWDFKQEWHNDIVDLIKDIVCFSNTVHDENCFIIFGISDDLQITGMKAMRRKQADILDTIEKLYFAGDVCPKISVETIKISGVEIDVLIVYNTDKTPIYLKKPYGKMKEGCIYTRTGDKNTPDNGNADIGDIENLWKKRIGFTKSHLEIIYDRMHNKLEWSDNDGYYYHIYRPEYTIELLPEEDNQVAPFYSYAMTNESTQFSNLYIKYQNTVLEHYQIVVLDSGRLSIPVPEWGFINDSYSNTKLSYKYYIQGSNRYKVLTFLYDKSYGDQKIALMDLFEVVLLFVSEEEREAFESFLFSSLSLVNENASKIKSYEHIYTESEEKTKVYTESLRTGVELKLLLEAWRKERCLPNASLDELIG